MAKLKLEVIPEADPTKVAILQFEKGITMNGAGPDQYICGKCGAVLLNGTLPNQVQNMVLKCSCGTCNRITTLSTN